MNLFDNKKIWREIIVDHYSKPRYRNAIDNSKYITITQVSDKCVDNFQIGILIENDIIKNGFFYGEGCAISISSIDIMIKNLISKTLDEALEMVKNYYLMIFNNEMKYDKNLLNDLIVFSNVYKQPNRMKCATIGIDGIFKIISNKNIEK